MMSVPRKHTSAVAVKTAPESMPVALMTEGLTAST